VYKVLSVTLISATSRDIPKDAAFQCDETDVLMDMIKGTPGIIYIYI
jgi:hypothetical protein